MQGLIPVNIRRGRLLRRFLFLLILMVLIGTIPALAADESHSPSAAPVASPLQQADGTITVSNHVPQNFTFVGITHLVRVDDADLNVTPGGGNDTVNVNVQQVGNPGSLVVLTLNEQVDNPGVFTNTINNSAVVSTPNVSISFTYTDVMNSLGIPIPRQVVLNVVATPANVYVDPTSGLPGESFVAVVEDPDQNLLPGGGNDSVNVRIRNNSAGAMTNVVFQLMEVPNQEGVFAGIVNNIDPAFDADPVVGNVLRVRYTDTDSFGNTGPVDAFYTLVGLDGALTVTPDPVAPNGVLDITVADLDANINEGGNNDNSIINVEVTDLTNAETLMLTLPETETPGVFHNVFDLHDFTNVLVAGDQIRVRYPEPTDGGVNNIDVIVNVAAGTDGVLTIPGNQVITEPLPITVVDVDANVTGGANNDSFTVLVELCNPACGGGVPVSVFETNTIGEFQGNFDILATFPTAVPGDTIRVTYGDVTDSQGLPVNRTAETLLIEASDAVLDVEPTLIAPGDELTVSVYDPDKNLTPGSNNDTVMVTIQNLTNTDWPIIPITLYETDTEGLFQLTFPTQAEGNAPAVGDILRVTYVDEVPQGGGAPVTYTVDVTVTAFGTDATIIADDSIPGSPVHVRVIDGDRGANKITVYAQNLTTNSALEEFSLGRVSNTDTFEGYIPTAYGESDVDTEDGFIYVKGGDVIRVFYKDTLNTTGNFDVVIYDDANITSRSSFAPFCDRGTAINNPTWHAEYFNNTTLTDPPLVVAEETEMQIFWAESAPFIEIPADNWSARWTTTLNFTENAKYRFRVGADDGVRFYIDGALVIDKFVNQQFTVYTADQVILPGNHTFVIEFFDAAYDAALTVDCLFLDTPVPVINAEGNQDLAFPSDTRFDQAVAHITTGRINVRANPGVTAAWISYVYIYERYPILGITEDAQWTLIQLKDGRSGWISSQFVKRYEQTPVQIFPIWSGSETVLPNIEVAGYATAELKLRASPREGTELTLVPANAAFRVLARTQSGAWYKIEYEGITGWVYAPYVVLTNGTVQDLPREG